MMKSMVFAAAAISCVSAIDLTPANYDDVTAGKTVFIKFFAPWCGHCKKIKPDWDKLAGEYDNHATIVIGDVDCTAEGKPLCDSNGVGGFPTLKHGDPSALEDYSGGRTYADLETFAKGLKPVCSPGNIDLCDEEGKAAIEKVQAMSADELAAAISEGDTKISDAESLFKGELEKLQATYAQLQKDQETTIKTVKDSGLGMMKAVQAANKKGAAASKEEL